MNMKKMAVLLVCLALAVTCMTAAAELETASASKITGEIADGFYYLRVNLDPDDAGEWAVDDLAQDPSVVSLDGTEETEDSLTARYAPEGDGEVTVTLRHFTGFVCDELHTFDLRVADGRITENFGGSYTASPAEEDLDVILSGDWAEAETQFTSMRIEKNPERGWNVEITSPMTHGAYVFTATIFYDCELDAFVYEDGAVCDLLPSEGEEPAVSEPRATGLYGTLSFVAETEDSLALAWYDSQRPDELIAFTPAGA